LKQPPLKTTPPSSNGQFKGKHILSVEQLARPDLDQLFAAAAKIKQMIQDCNPQLAQICNGVTMVSAFREASTRTDMSFQAAMTRLGGAINSPGSGWDFSSQYKGERGSDTTRALAYRAAHHIDQLKQAGDIITNPVLISGGDGIGEHPTQALLDLFTITQEQLQVDNLTITMVGDLKHGRTVHSLAKLLVKYDAQNVTLNLVSPDILAMPTDIIEAAEQHGFSVNQTTDINSVLPESDIVYWTRVQEERFADPADYHAIKGAFVFTPDMLSHMKPTASLMHPLPRKHEMGTPEDHDIIDADKRSAYFRQMHNGLFVRMALLTAVTGRLDQLG
jgi:aspartate carbamoyltransferase